jgi:2-iminobutanoate/2-iminopropanoate deaminase
MENCLSLIYKAQMIVYTKDAPEPIGPYSQAVVANGFLYMSGQVALNPSTGEMNQVSLEEETHQVMRNINAVLLEAGYGFEHIIKVSIFLSDMELFAAVNKIYGSYFSGDFPARETVAVKGLPKAANVEISCTAFKG